MMPRRTDICFILVIDASPIVIGQACEFPTEPRLSRLPRIDDLEVGILEVAGIARG